jgi:hypothetical protein
MKHIVVSALAVAAFGATVVGTQPAAAAGWVGSAWNPIGTNSHLTTSEGFTANFAVSTAYAPANVTASANATTSLSVSVPNTQVCVGTWCPTVHQAFSLCRDGHYLSGPIVLGYFPNQSSFTSVTTGNGAGYWLGGQAVTPDTGFCPSSAPMIQGGVNVWNY